MDKRRVLVTVVIATLLCFGWWYFCPAPKELLPNTQAMVTASKPTPLVIQQATPSAQVVAPVMAPAPVGNSASNTEATIDPRLKPNTAIADYIHLVEAGDYVAACKYVQIPPNVDPKQFVAFEQQDPNFQQGAQKVHDIFQAALAVAPEYDNTGNIAIFHFPTPVDGESLVRMKKIGDYWYLD